MMEKEPIDLSGIRTYSLFDRKSKVGLKDFGKPWVKGGSFSRFLENLPGILGASDLKHVIHAMVSAKKNDRMVMFAMGAHVIKTGLNPLIIDMMERGILSGVSMNGAGIIHDFEVAMAGRTSEDVDSALHEGTFGMASETCAILGEAIKRADRESMGLGESVGKTILEKKLPHAGNSILASGARLGIPVTVHVAIGTDIIHMHPEFDPKSAGGASHRDFRIFAKLVSRLSGGVFLNVGSAVILPEVFLKAVSVVRNLGFPLEDITTANFDFIRQYRPMTNVVNRPTMKGGNGFHLTGHHEIMIPLLFSGVIEALEASVQVP